MTVQLTAGGGPGRYGKLAAMEGAIFDMDGTLLDSMFIWDSMGENYLRQRGIRPEPGVREVLRPMSLRQAADYFVLHYGVPETAERIMEEVNRSIEGFYCLEALAKPGVKDVLRRWKDAGVRLCVATATDRRLAEAALGRNGLLPLFEAVFTCGEVGAGKDRPDIFLKALDFLGTPEKRTWVFEDALFAAESAKKTGMPLAVVWDASAEGQRGRLTEIADVEIRDWREVEI